MLMLCLGKCGPKDLLNGMKGERGPPGDKGEPGPPGLMGLSGDQGLQGFRVSITIRLSMQ